MTRYLLLPLIALLGCEYRFERSNRIAADAPRTITPDKPESSASNRTAIEAARGRVDLPPGVVYLDKALLLDGRHSGLTLDGTGTTLRSQLREGGYIDRGALSVRDVTAYSFYEARPTASIMPANQVGWLFNPVGNGWFYQGPITRIVSGEKIPASSSDGLSYMRAGRAVPFTAIGAGATNLQTPNGHPFGVGETVLLTDGPLINELRTEFRRVKATSTTGVEIDVKTVKPYKAGAIVGGDWPRDITFRGITFAGDLGPAFLGPAVDLRFEDCTFARNAAFPNNAGWLSISGCARISFVRCKIDCGMTITSSHDIHFRDCAFPLCICEQGVRRVTFDGCTIGAHYFDARVYSTDFTVRGCTFSGTQSIAIYDGWEVSDCKITGGRDVQVRGGQSTIRNLVSDVPIRVQAGYEGAPAGSGRGITLANVRAPAIHCEAGTSGTITGRSCPVTGSLGEWKISPKQP